MDPTLGQPLVEPAQPSRRRRALLGVVAGGLALATLGAVAARSPKRRGPVNMVAFPYSNSTRCWLMTGGTCRVSECDKGRGPTFCYNGGLGNGYQCLCQDGYCAGPDGSCYPHQNTLIASDVTLSATYKGADYYLVATSCNQRQMFTGPWSTPTKVSISVHGNPLAKWSIWQLPGKPGKDKAYMLVPKSEPNCVVSESYKNHVAGLGPVHYLVQTMSPWHWGIHGDGSNNDKHASFNSGNDQDPGHASFVFQKLQDGRYHLKLAGDQGVSGAGLFLYVSGVTSMASIWDVTLGKVGPTGEWKVTPPLPDSVGLAPVSRAYYRA